MEDLLRVEDLSVNYRVEKMVVRALRSISLSVRSGEILGVIGESGSGKSTLASAILRMIKPPGEIVQGKVIYQGRDLLFMPQEEFKRVLWTEIALVPQASQNALNPVETIMDHFYETALSHGLTDREEVTRRAFELLKTVRLDPERTLKLYPHQLSGGMKQRVVIALSLLLRPKLLILDEPTSALDVVNQKLVMEIVRRVNRELNVTVIFITHDIAVVAAVANRLSVMYMGLIVEEGGTEWIVRSPLHPYTRLLISSVPSLRGKIERVEVPEWVIGDYRGCPFLPRCKIAVSRCAEELPPLFQKRDRRVRCFVTASD